MRPLGNEHHTPPVPESRRPQPAPPVAAGYKDDARALWNEPLVGAEHVYPGGADDGWVGEATDEALAAQDDASALREVPLPVPEINPAAPELSAAAAAARHGAAEVARSHDFDIPEGAVAPTATGAALSRHAVKGLGGGALREAVRADRDIDAELAADVLEGDAGEDVEGDALAAAGYPRLGVTGMTAAGIRGSAADPSLANRQGNPGPIPSVAGGHKGPHSRQRRGIATWVLADGAGAVHLPRIAVPKPAPQASAVGSAGRPGARSLPDHDVAAAVDSVEAALFAEPEAAAAADAAAAVAGAGLARCEGVSRVTLPGSGTGPRPSPPPLPAGSPGPHRPAPVPGSEPSGREPPRNSGPELGEGPEVDQPSGPGAGGIGSRRPGPRPGQQPPGAGPIHGTPVVQQQGHARSGAARQAFSGAVDGQAASSTGASAGASGRAAAADRSEALGDGGGGAAELGLGGRQPASGEATSARTAATGNSDPCAGSGNLTLDESPAAQKELDAALSEAEAERDGLMPRHAGQASGTAASAAASASSARNSSPTPGAMQPRQGLARPGAATANGEGLGIASRSTSHGGDGTNPRRSFGTLASGWEAGASSGSDAPPWQPASASAGLAQWRIMDVSSPPPAAPAKAAGSASPSPAQPEAGASPMRPGIAGVETDDADLAESTVDHQHDSQWAEHWNAADRSHLQREAALQPQPLGGDAFAFTSIVRSMEAAQVGLGFDASSLDPAAAIHHHGSPTGVPGVETDDADYAISVSDGELEVPQAKQERERGFAMRSPVQLQVRSAPQAAFGTAAAAAPGSNGNGNIKATAETAEEAHARFERARQIAKKAARAAKADAMAAAAAVAEKTHLSERAHEARDAAATMVATAAAAAEAALPRARRDSGSGRTSAAASPLADTASAVLGLGKSAVVLAGAATATVAAAVGAAVTDVAKAVPVAAHEAKVAYEAMTPVSHAHEVKVAVEAMTPVSRASTSTSAPYSHFRCTSTASHTSSS